MIQSFLLSLVLMMSFLFAGANVEIKARLIKHDKVHLYMESKTEQYTIIKKELTKEGVKQILKNKDTELTLFIPQKSIKKRTTRIQEDEL